MTHLVSERGLTLQTVPQKHLVFDGVETVEKPSVSRRVDSDAVFTADLYHSAGKFSNLIGVGECFITGQLCYSSLQEASQYQ